MHSLCTGDLPTHQRTDRGSWVDNNWPNNKRSALQPTLDRPNCIADSEEELENHMTDLVDWDPDIPVVGAAPVSKEFSLLCHHLGFKNPVTATTALEVGQATQAQWEDLPLTTNYHRSHQ
jgi:hypothetical protein